jgi:hypothetical protein
MTFLPYIVITTSSSEFYAKVVRRVPYNGFSFEPHNTRTFRTIASRGPPLINGGNGAKY